MQCGCGSSSIDLFLYLATAPLVTCQLICVSDRHVLFFNVTGQPAVPLHGHPDYHIIRYHIIRYVYIDDPTDHNLFIPSHEPRHPQRVIYLFPYSILITAGAIDSAMPRDLATLMESFRVQARTLSCPNLLLCASVDLQAMVASSIKMQRAAVNNYRDIGLLGCLGVANCAGIAMIVLSILWVRQPVFKTCENANQSDFTPSMKGYILGMAVVTWVFARVAKQSLRVATLQIDLLIGPSSLPTPHAPSPFSCYPSFGAQWPSAPNSLLAAAWWG